VHKGLDLVLEAFAGMPDMNLTVCGPISSDHAFEQLYRTELYHTPNIRTAGWVDVSGAEFRDIVRNCVAVIFPSCAEAQATSVINCMRAGLIPMVTRKPASGGRFRVTLENASVVGIRSAVQQLAALTSEELELRAQRTWDYTAAQHSHDAYREAYGQIVRKFIADTTKRSVTS